MTSLRWSSGVASRACQVRNTIFRQRQSLLCWSIRVDRKFATQIFARARCVPPLARGRLTTQPMQTQLSHRSASTYEGNNCGFRSSSIAACAQHGNASSAPLPQKPDKTKDQYCRMCGTQMELAIPKGEAAWRHMCSDCGYIDYVNPKMVRMAPGQPLSVLEASLLLTFVVYTAFPEVLPLALSCCHCLSYRL